MDIKKQGYSEGMNDRRGDDVALLLTFIMYRQDPRKDQQSRDVTPEPHPPRPAPPVNPPSAAARGGRDGGVEAVWMNITDLT